MIEASAARMTARHLVLVAMLVCIWFTCTAWVRPLMLPDEGRYVGVAWEMLRSGDWLTPTLNGLPYFHKPPLLYWITAASMAVWGDNVWAARAAPLLGACVGAVALYMFVHRWMGERRARFVLLALMVQPLFFVGAQFVNLDMLVAGCIAATILLLAHSALVLERGQLARSSLWAAYAMAALGVLSKGLIGAVLPALVVGAWLLLRGRWRTLLALWSWPGAIGFFLLAGPWFLAMHQIHPGFTHYFFVVQHFERFSASGFNNAQPWWFFVAVLLLATLPWWPWLRPLVDRRFWLDPAHGPQRQLMLVWIVCVTAFFSLPQSKLIGYVLPAIPALMCLVADACCTRFHTNPWRTQRGWWASSLIAALAGLAVVATVAFNPMRSTHELATLLGAAHRVGEPVVMLDNYYFDAAFVARLQDPVYVVDRWKMAQVKQQDTWRKELSDAGEFDTAAADKRLIDTTSWAQLVCQTPVSWVLAAPLAVESHPVLRHAEAVATVRGTTLWRVDSRLNDVSAALPCAQPISNSRP